MKNSKFKNGFVPYDFVDSFYHSLCDYKDYLDGQPFESNNTFDSFVKMRKCETCDTIFDMFCTIFFDNFSNPNPIYDFTFTPTEADEYLKEYNLLYSSKIVKSQVNNESKGV